MLRSLTDLLVRRHRRVLLLTVLLVPVLAFLGGRVEEHLSVGGFVDPSAPSSRTAAHLEAAFGTAAPNYVLVATARTGTVSDTANAEAGRALVGSLRARPGVLDVLSPWTVGTLPPGSRSPLISNDDRQAVLALRLGGDEDDQRRAAEDLTDVGAGVDRFTLAATGPAEVSRQAAERAEKDLIRAELIAVPLTLLALLFVFRGWRAALVPVGVAVLAVLGAFALLRAVALATTVSVFALNLTTGLALGLAIDYSLLLVARFREERAVGRPVVDAVRVTMATAGRTVVISATTVALCMLALLVFPVAYLRSFAYAGVATVVAAAMAAVVVVPALLLAVGHRLGSGSTETAASVRFWSRQARRVTRRPWRWALGATALLLVAGSPFLRVDPGRIDHRALPAASGAHAAAEQLARSFTAAEFHPVSVAVPWLDPDDEAGVRALVGGVLAVPGVRRVDSVLGFTSAAGTVPPTTYHERFRGAAGAGTWLSVALAADPDTDEAERAVRAIRSIDPRLGVGGTTAAVLDAVDGVVDRAPLALALIALTTLVLLFLMTGSVLVPVKALVVNLLSLSATFGALVWVFQDGHLAGPLAFTPTGHLDVFSPILVFCIAFGLSMDYEVFLLARIAEVYAISGDNSAAIEQGLARTGRIVTAAAGLLAIVLVAIGTSGMVTVKLFGLGLALAVVVDAVLVRGALVPALMRLAGGANWWAPRPLRRLHGRIGVVEGAAVPPAAAPAALAGSGREG